MVPSGFTHMIMARRFNEVSGHGVDGLDFLLSEMLPFFQIGSIAPDLPYSQAIRLQNSDETLGDDFHWRRTTAIPLAAFPRIQAMPDGELRDEAFSFFLGYVAHVVGDGVCHPFVRDKVGDYLDNKTAHRVLEMRLDVILLHELTSRSGSGVNFNFTRFPDQVTDLLSKSSFSYTADLLAELIREIYGRRVAGKQIREWIGDISTIVKVAANKNNFYYAKFPAMKNVLFPDVADVIRDNDQDLILEPDGARGRKLNFAGCRIHFIEDCLSAFYRAFTPLAVHAYRHVYEGAPPLTEKELPAINLDTGRGLAVSDGNDLDQPVVYWSKK